MLVSVELKDKSKLSFLVGKEECDYTNRGFRMGLSIFHNGKYVLNFVLVEEDEVSLKSDMLVKGIKDIGFFLFADAYSLTILKHYAEYYVTNKSSFLDRVDIDDKAMNIFSQLTFKCLGEGNFTKALEIAMTSPYLGSNLYTEIPNDIEEVTL